MVSLVFITNITHYICIEQYLQMKVHFDQSNKFPPVGNRLKLNLSRWNCCALANIYTRLIPHKLQHLLDLVHLQQTEFVALFHRLNTIKPCSLAQISSSWYLRCIYAKRETTSEKFCLNKHCSYTALIHILAARTIRAIMRCSAELKFLYRLLLALK